MATRQRVIAHTRGPPLEYQVNFTTLCITVSGNDIFQDFKVITLQNLLRHTEWHLDKGLFYYATQRQLNMNLSS